MNRPEQVGGLRQVLKREFDEQLLARCTLREFALDCVIVIAAPDRVVEDRRIGCQPGDRKLVDIATKPACL